MYGNIKRRLSACAVLLFVFSALTTASASLLPDSGGICPKVLRASEGVPRLGVDDLGSYLARGGYLIPIEKSLESFTVHATDPADLDSVPGLRQKRRVRHDTYLVEVEPSALENAIEFMRKKGVVTHHAYKVQRDEPTPYYLTERIVVRVRPTVTADGMKAMAENFGLEVVGPVDGLANTYTLKVTPKTGVNPIKAANTFAKQPNVEMAEPDLLNQFWHNGGPVFPSDKLFKKQWHLHASKDTVDLTPEQAAQFNPASGIDAPGAWEFTNGEGAVVAILDDGFDLNHPDLKAGAKKIVSPKDFTDGDEEPFPGQTDYHGTPCAGVALAAINDDGVVGVAPGCAFMPVRFPLNVTDTELRKIFMAISKEADVVSCSWGPPPVYAPLSTVVKETFSELFEKGGRRGKGLAIAFAAGNANSPINDPDNKGFEWLDYGWGMVRVTKGPILNGYVDHPGVLGVGGVSSLAKKSLFSSWGKGVDVTAPTNNFDPIDPRKKVEGLGIVTADNERVGEGFNKDSIYTDRFGGTSSATPTVAGVLGLVFAANQDLTAAEAYRVLEDTADKIEDDSVDPHLGTSYGNYEKDETGRMYSKWFGYGRVNAKKAVERAIALKNSKAKATALVGAFLRDRGGLKEAHVKTMVGEVQLPAPPARTGLAKLLAFDKRDREVENALKRGFTAQGEQVVVRDLYRTAYDVVFAALTTGQPVPEVAVLRALRARLVEPRRAGT